MERSVITAAALTLCLCARAGAGVKTLGWMCHDYDMNYLREVIKRAPAFGVNHFQMDQLLPKHGSGLPESDQQTKDIRELSELCKENGIEFYIWVREINGFPDNLRVDGKIDLDSDVTWNWLRDKYRRIFELFPEMSGVMLTLRESNVPVQDSGRVRSEMSGSERVAKLVSTIYEVCKERGKTLYVRDFSIAPGEMQNIIDAVNLMPKEVRVMTKAVARDWHPYLPDNPAFGKYPGREQIAEFDLASEYNGQGEIPYVIADEISRRWQNARANGAVGAVGRIDRFENHILDTLDEANAHVFSDIVLRGSGPRVAVRNYCVGRFGEEAADTLTECLLRTYDISNGIYFTLRNKFINNHSTVPDIGYADSHIRSQSLAIWIPEENVTEEELQKPTTRTMEKVISEKDKAIMLAQRNLEELGSVKDKLADEDYQWIRKQFQRAADLAVFWKPMAVAYMESRVCLNAPTAAHLAAARASLDEFSRAIDKLEDEYGSDFQLSSASKGRGNAITRARALHDQIKGRLDALSMADAPSPGN